MNIQAFARVVKVCLAIFLAVCLLLMVTGLLTWEYFSKATLEAPAYCPSHSEIYSSDQPKSGREAWLEQPVPKIVQSTEILYPVIDKLNLCDAWAEQGQKISREEAYRQLLDKLECREIPRTDLVEIGVYSADRQEAAIIANAIAVSYQQKRRERKEALIVPNLEKLRQEVTDQRKAVEAAREAVLRLRKEKGITDENPEQNGSDDGKMNREYITAKRDYVDVKNILEELENRLSSEGIQLKKSITPFKIWEVAAPAEHHQLRLNLHLF